MTHVKICGITTLADARAAVDAGADLLGFIFYAESPRYVPPEQVREIARAARSERAADAPPLRCVGVFVHEPPARILQILEQTGLDYAQLHSEETPAVLQSLQGRAFKALRPTSAGEARQAAATFAHLGPTDGPRWLIDAYDPAAYGGTGQKADWGVAAELAREHPGLLLAGGLTPDNVGDAVRLVRPWGVDVSSGVEVAPGRKDHGKIRAFVAAARAAAE